MPEDKKSDFPEVLTTGKRRRPRALSLPEIMLAGKDDEEPPAGYEVVLGKDGKPKIPRQFRRLSG